MRKIIVSGLHIMAFEFVSMIYLTVLCHRSSLLVVSQRPRRRASLLMNTQQRPFFSFLSSSRLTTEVEEETTIAKEKKQQEEATRILLDGVRHRISIQNAHPLGPWQAILTVVQDHYNGWVKVQEEADAAMLTTTTKRKDNHVATAEVVQFRVLDLACGPRGEPGTTIAHALPLAAVHCTDSCSVSVAAIPVFEHVDKATLTDIEGGATTIQLVQLVPGTTQQPPPKNLTKSITDLTDLSSYNSNSFDAIICCYGYNLSSNIPHALSEAYRVLVPGGVLVIATWERSAMLAIGRDVKSYVESGGCDPSYYTASFEDDLPPTLVPKIELSGVGELEGLLVTSGFDQPQAVVATSLVYPIDLGSTPDDQFAMGTILVRDDLESLGALDVPPAGSNGAGGWNNLAEEAFWMNVQKYADVVGANLLLRDNTFKLTVSTKKVI